MIHIGDGSIVLNSLEIPASLTRPRFLRSELASQFVVLTENPPWVSYKLSPKPVGAHHIGVILFFERDRLRQAHLWVKLPGHDGDWYTWTEANERQREAIHDALLQEWLGDPPYHFCWGHVASVNDGKTGGSHILVSYSPKA